MKIRILRTTVADGRLIRAGATEDVGDSDAKALILLGKAVAVERDEPVEPVEELNSENSAPVIADEAPRRGRKPRKV